MVNDTSNNILFDYETIILNLNLTGDVSGIYTNYLFDKKNILLPPRIILKDNLFNFKKKTNIDEKIKNLFIDKNELQKFMKYLKEKNLLVNKQVSNDVKNKNKNIQYLLNKFFIKKNIIIDSKLFLIKNNIKDLKIKVKNIKKDDDNNIYKKLFINNDELKKNYLYYLISKKLETKILLENLKFDASQNNIIDNTIKTIKKEDNYKKIIKIVKDNKNKISEVLNYKTFFFISTYKNDSKIKEIVPEIENYYNLINSFYDNIRKDTAIKKELEKELNDNNKYKEFINFHVSLINNFQFDKDKKYLSYKHDIKKGIVLNNNNIIIVDVDLKLNKIKITDKNNLKNTFLTDCKTRRQKIIISWRNLTRKKKITSEKDSLFILVDNKLKIK